MLPNWADGGDERRGPGRALGLQVWGTEMRTEGRGRFGGEVQEVVGYVGLQPGRDEAGQNVFGVSAQGRN